MPKLSKFRITKRAVDALPTDRDATYRDADLKGFAVRTKPSGAKIYLVVYRNKEGRTRSYMVGSHGPQSPDEARKRAKAILALVDAGDDPAEQKKRNRAALSVSDLCDLFLTDLESGKIKGRKGPMAGPEAWTIGNRALAYWPRGRV